MLSTDESTVGSSKIGNASGQSLEDRKWRTCLRGLEGVLGVLQCEAGSKLHELTRTRLLHALNELRRSERRSTLLETRELARLIHDGLETERGLDVGDILLLRSLTLLLGRHLTGEALLLSGVPLAGGCEDVLEGFLRLTIGGVACGLTGLEQAKGLRPALDIGVGDCLADGASLAEGLGIAQEVAGGGSTGASCLFHGSEDRRIEGAGLGEAALDLALQLTAHGFGGTGIARARRHRHLLVGGRFDFGLRDGAFADVLEEGFVKPVPIWIECLEFRSALDGCRLTERRAFRSDTLL